VWYGCANDKFGGNGTVLAVHQAGCSGCWEGESGEGDIEVGGEAAGGGYHAYPSVGGLLAEQAVDVLRRFYVRGNARAPVPHRPLQTPPVG
jgi:tRNA-specific adenosine deaminase 2